MFRPASWLLLVVSSSEILLMADADTTKPPQVEASHSQALIYPAKPYLLLHQYPNPQYNL
jgi:hypothetical protein